MQALIKREKSEGLWLEEVPEPEVGHDDVLIQVSKAGICGTDLHIYNWDDWASKTVPVPLVVGHEFVGKVIEVGPGVTDFRPGEIVSGEGHVVCGRCRNCMAGRRHLCNDTAGIGVTRWWLFAGRRHRDKGKTFRRLPNLECEQKARPGRGLRRHGRLHRNG